MLIDTHTHAHFNAFKDDSEEVVKRALQDNIWMITVGTQKDTSLLAVELAEKFPQGVYAAIGLHPVHTTGGVEEKVAEGSELSFKARKEDLDFDFYRGLIRKSKKVVAIGETGLDYFRIPVAELAESKLRQRTSFLDQIKLADEFSLPIIIHCRDAHADVQELLAEQISKGNVRNRGVMHCFTSNLEDARKYIELGFYISFSGIVTFSKELAAVAKELPLDKIVIETDAPYLTPVPFRGKRNEPAYVKHTAEFLAQLKGVGFEELAAATTNNAKKILNI